MSELDDTRTERTEVLQKAIEAGILGTPRKNFEVILRYKFMNMDEESEDQLRAEPKDFIDRNVTIYDAHIEIIEI